MPNQSRTGRRPTRSLMAPNSGCIAMNKNSVMNEISAVHSFGNFSVLLRYVGM